MKWKTILAAHGVAAAAVAFVMTSSSPAQALPSQEVWRFYYKTANFDEEVGAKYVTSCWGTVNQLIWGKTSSYSVTVSDSCQGGGGSPRVRCYINNTLSYCPSDICDSDLFSC